MKKNKSKQLLLTALTGMMLLMPVRHAYIPQTVLAAQVSAAHDSRLSAFDIAPGVLSPAFSPDITEYTSTVEADVTSVSVQAVPRAAASGAVIAAVEGRDGLHPGVNTIKVTCSAADNTYTVYTITLTVGSADAGLQQPNDTADTQGDASGSDTQGVSGSDTQGASGSDTQPSGSEDTPAGDPDAEGLEGSIQKEQDGQDPSQPETGSTGNAGSSGQSKKRSLSERLSGAVKADGTVKLSGAMYQLSNNFNYGSITQDIPSAFGQGSVQIGATNYSTLYCQTSGVHLVYMENTDGKGSTGFYFYDEMKQVVERFKYSSIGDQFVIFINNAREEIPAGYEEKALKFPSEKKAAAYQNSFSDDLKDYYLVYGIYSDGTSGWYLYDKKQGTCMRYSSAFTAALQPEEESGEEEVERTVSLTKYNTLNEKYTELKDNRVKIVSILIVAIVVLIIIFTAILLRSRDEDEEDETDVRVSGSRKRKPAKASKQTETISKSSLAAGRNFEGSAGKRSKRVTKTFTQESEDQVPKRTAAGRDNISTPEEIRAQLSRGQTNTAASSPETVQMAAERMRQSVRYSKRIPKEEPAQAEHDPMDDWDMEESAGRRPQRTARTSRKKHSHIDDDMEIMDLNDL